MASVAARLVLLCSFSALAALTGGCSREQKEEEALSTSAEALSAVMTRTYGFESLTDWTPYSSTPTLALSDTRTEGLKSLSVSGGGWSSVISRTLSKEEPGADLVGFDLRIPSAQPNPDWYGTVELFVDIPSRGVNNQPLGLHMLKLWTPGQWRRAEFAIPGWIKSAMNGSYSDLKWRIQLNVPTNSTGQYLVDKLALGGTAPPCTPQSDNNPCTADTCDANGQQLHTPVALGTSCSDGNPCNGSETCAAGSQCTSGAPPVLDDGNPCTTDTCTPSAGVKHTPVATGTACDDTDVCNGREVCSSAGACRTDPSTVLDDGNPCTNDACDPATGVVHVAREAGVACSDGNVCNGTEKCDGSGTCLAGQPLVLSDGNPCTVDTCSPMGGVSHSPSASGTKCADANLCNGTEKCDGAGQCAPGVALVIDDDNPCTDDSCDPTFGVKHKRAAAGTSCADPNVCDDSATCNVFGACVRSASYTKYPKPPEPTPCVGERALTVHLPRGLGLADAALHAEGSRLLLSAGASVRHVLGGYGAISSVGSATTTLATGSQAGATLSVPAVSLAAQANIYGFVRSEGGIQVDPAASVSGPVSPSASVHPLGPQSLTFTFPATTGPDLVVSGPFTPASDTAYGVVSVRAGGSVFLTAGDYHLRSLTVEPGGTLLVDNVQGPVRVFIHGAFTFRGAVNEQDPLLGTTLFAVSGTQGVLLASSFSGVVFAPSAPVVIASTPTPHVGAFFGASVDLQGSVEHRPFNPGNCAEIDDGCGAVFGCPATRLCTPGADLAKIRPIAGCIVERADGTRVGRFAYENTGTDAIRVARGADNELGPTGTPQFQPAQFEPGVRMQAFHVAFDDSVTWKVGNRQATLTRSSPKCEGVVQLLDSPVIVAGTHDNETGEELPGSGSLPTPIAFEVPERLKVVLGGAGDGTAHLTFRNGTGTQVTCTYRGGSSVARAVRDIDRARGRFYNFQSCSDGTDAGATTMGTDWGVNVLSGDPTFTETTVQVSIGPGCSEGLDAPIPADVSILTREAFAWEETTELPTTDSEGLPALHYAWIYVETKEAFDALERMRIYHSIRPIFSSDVGKYMDRCGVVDSSGDGTGIFVHALLPAAVYNAWRQSALVVLNRGDGTIPFRAVVLQPIPDQELANPDGTVSWTMLQQSGVRPYLDAPPVQQAWGIGIPIVDDVIEAGEDVANRGVRLVAGVPVIGGVVGGIVDVGGTLVNTAISVAPTLDEIIEVTADIVEGVAEVATGVIGEINQFLFGSISVTLDLEVLNRDPTFNVNDHLTRAWGAPPVVGPELSLPGAEVRIMKWIGPLPASFTGRLDGNGRVTMRIGKAGFRRGDSGVCVKLNTREGQITSGFTENEFCDFQLTRSDWKGFDEDLPPPGGPDAMRLEANDWQVHALAQVIDSATYVRNVVQNRVLPTPFPPQAEIGVGLVANIVGALNGRRAFAPCFDFTGTDAIPQLIAQLGGGASTGAAGLSSYPLMTRDIFLPYIGDGGADSDGKRHSNSRGVVTHEYGHFLMCAMLYDISSSDALVRLLSDRIPEGDTNSELDFTAQLMEAFADFFASQVAGGTNYVRTDNMTVGTGMGYCTGADCLERNYAAVLGELPPFTEDAAFKDRVRRYVSIFHDVFDSPLDAWRADSQLPTNVDAWNVDPATNKLVPAAAGFGMSVDDRVAVPGVGIVQWINAALEDCVVASGSSCALDPTKTVRGLARAMRDNGATWCDACELLRPHYADSPTKRHEMWRDCIGTSGLREVLADFPDPDPNLRLNGADCSVCGSREISVKGKCKACKGFEVEVNNECVPCPPDTVQVGNSCEPCPDEHVSVGNTCVACEPWQGEVAGENRCRTCSIDYSIGCQQGTCRGAATVSGGIPPDDCPQVYRFRIHDADDIPDDMCPSGLTLHARLLNEPQTEAECITKSVHLYLYGPLPSLRGDFVAQGRWSPTFGRCSFRAESIQFTCAERDAVGNDFDLDIIIPGETPLLELQFGSEPIVK